MQITDYLEVWYKALASKFGCVIAVSDVSIAKQRLYKARSESGDPDLDGISIRVSPVLPNEELWLTRQAPKPQAKAKETSDGT